MLKLTIIGLTFALALGVSGGWILVGQGIKEAENKPKRVLLFITVSALLSLVSLALCFIVMWPPIDWLSVTLGIIMLVVLVALGIFIVSTRTW